MNEPKPGSFTPYLEFVNKEASQAPNQPSQTQTGLSGSPIGILEILSRQVQQALPYSDLQILSGMDAKRFQSALMSLQEAEAVTIDASRMIVQVTDKGVQTAKLARVA